MTDPNDFKKLGKEMVDYIASYMEGIDKRPPLAQVEPGYLSKLVPNTAPQRPDAWEDVMKDVEEIIMPGVTHWQSPHFHAYFEADNSVPSIVADLLSDGLGSYSFTWESCPASTELESIVLDWLGKMIGLPREFLSEGEGDGGGVIQGSASEATLISLLAAKTKTVRRVIKTEPDKHKDQYDVLPKLIAYTSDQAHLSVEKASIITSVRMRILPSDDENVFRGEALQKAIEEDKSKGLIPFYACATLGTTGVCAFDNLTELGKICEKENMWMHIDAAYAGTAFICPEFRHLLEGVEYATSYNFNPHKMMRVTYACSVMWVKNESDIVDAFRVEPTYVLHKYQGRVRDLMHWQIPMAQPFRSLKLWFVLRLFGVEQLQEHVRKHVKLAHEFEELVRSDSRFEIVNRVVLGLVCFRLKGSNSRNEKLLKLIKSSGKIHMMGCDTKGKFILRFSISTASTELKHVHYAWDVIKTIVESQMDENCT